MEKIDVHVLGDEEPQKELERIFVAFINEASEVLKRIYGVDKALVMVVTDVDKHGSVMGNYGGDPDYMIRALQRAAVGLEMTKQRGSVQ